ncbi:DUF1501 domain-containing protein [Inhella sp.]|uniref:DUF1501 domain-containing protein n=1 Tax=Inhella sp. TaxID=1921806 RepID=UPI0035B160CC
MLQRRSFLQAGAAAALTPWPLMQALAQTSGPGYRALVCVFLFGGNDGNNTLVPVDARWSDYQRARPNLAIAREALLPLNLVNTGAERYGLHPAMAGVQQLVNAGQASVVANIGALLVPTTKADIQNRRVPLPGNLYSHSDQQNANQSALAEAVSRHGWGGRLLERSVAPGSTNRGYSAISLAGGNIWQAGDQTLSPYRVSPGGQFGFDFYSPGSSDPLSQAVGTLLGEVRTDPFEQTWLNMVGRSIENQRVLAAAVTSSTLTTAFPGTGLGQQLQMAARLIQAQAQLGLSRQCFFCSIGGFDTHGDDQLQRQNELLGELSDAIAAFHAALVEMNRVQEVGLFTASDFNRNLPSNGAGTDHAWGNHHLVMGGGLPGGRLLGRFPQLLINGPDDLGQGTWVPSTANEQLGVELARWFGADAPTLAASFPHAAAFPRLQGL